MDDNIKFVKLNPKPKSVLLAQDIDLINEIIDKRKSMMTDLFNLHHFLINQYNFELSEYAELSSMIYWLRCVHRSFEDSYDELAKVKNGLHELLQKVVKEDGQI